MPIEFYADADLVTTSIRFNQQFCTDDPTPLRNDLKRTRFRALLAGSLESCRMDTLVIG